MASVFDLLDPALQPAVPRAETDLLASLRQSMQSFEAEMDASTATGNILSTAATRHGQRIADSHAQRTKDVVEMAQSLIDKLRLAQGEGRLQSDLGAYFRDATERAVLTLDALRKRGDIFISHEAAGCATGGGSPMSS